jgi:selenoprotein W-related protein
MHRPRIEIHYCRQCQWLLRAAWYAQELLSTFGEQVGEVALIPKTGGVFQVILEGQLVWDRAARNGFPDIKVLKQAIRDGIAPDLTLGHIDRPKITPEQQQED